MSTNQRCLKTYEIVLPIIAIRNPIGRQLVDDLDLFPHLLCLLGTQVKEAVRLGILRGSANDFMLDPAGDPSFFCIMYQ
jgi:hypothetical protein